jgi:hypothetical protein
MILVKTIGFKILQVVTWIFVAPFLLLFTPLISISLTRNIMDWRRGLTGPNHPWISLEKASQGKLSGLQQKTFVELEKFSISEETFVINERKAWICALVDRIDEDNLLVVVQMRLLYFNFIKWFSAFDAIGFKINRDNKIIIALPSDLYDYI